MNKWRRADSAARFASFSEFSNAHSAFETKKSGNPLISRHPLDRRGSVARRMRATAGWKPTLPTTSFSSHAVGDKWARYVGQPYRFPSSFRP